MVEKILVRNGALDILKVVMALMVVGMHAGFLTDVSPISAYLTTNGLFRIAVPAFLLINGYFFYRISTTGSTAIWFKRVIYLYIFWMAVYSPAWVFSTHGGVRSIAINFTHTLIFGYYHLWYLAGMIGAAMLVILVHRLSTAVIAACAVAAFVAGVGVQYIGSYHLLGDGHLATILSLSWPHRNFLLFSFPFFCAGYLMHKHQVLDRINLRTAAIFVLVGTILLFAETIFNFQSAPSGAAFDNLASLAILCPAVFALFMKIEMKVQSKELSRYSTGIYLVHVLIILCIQPLLGNHGTAMTALVIVAAVLSSFLLIKVSKRAPFIL